MVGWDFTAETVSRRYLGDITYLPIADGRNLYLATVIDLCSRKLAEWAMADHMRTALGAARRERSSLAGVFHSYHGSVYTSKAYTALCEKVDVLQSMGAVGSSPLTGYSSRDPLWRHAGRIDMRRVSGSWVSEGFRFASTAAMTWHLRGAVGA